MKLNLGWLKDHIDLNDGVDIFQVAEVLTNIGLEVEPLLFNKGSFDGIVVAKVLSAETHPNADKLRVCKVSDGTNEYQIVCGAPNARTGIRVSLARDGAYIIGADFNIKKTSIRGIDSCGMMCSERELLLSDEHNGIIELPDECRIGNDFASEYKVFEKLPIEVSLTPNRGDAASVRGIAKDLAAAGLGKLKEIKTPKLTEEFKTDFKVKDGNYGFFTGRELRNVKNCESPSWLKRRLAIQGVSSNTLVVDVLNYIMFDLGQPMHAYDASSIGREISVEMAKGTNFIDLKGRNLKLTSEILTVQDNDSDICIAGAMGSDKTKTKLDSNNIFIESAYFPMEAVAVSGQKLNITTDARFRFERGIDPEITEIARDMACEIILQNCGGQCSDAVSNSKHAEPTKIDFDINETKRLLGYDVSIDETECILQKLSFTTNKKTNTLLEITIPNFRHDCSISADIVEEIARIKGLDQIKSTPFVPMKSKRSNTFEKIVSIKKTLAAKGFMEVLNMSFVSQDSIKAFAEPSEDLLLENPIGGMDHMRSSLLPSMLENIAENWNISSKKMAFFESGTVFFGTEPNEQNEVIAGVCCQKEDSVLESKAAILESLKTLDIDLSKLKIESSIVKYGHPKKTFSLVFGREPIGIFGEIHPSVQKQFGIKEKVSFFELFFEKIPSKKIEKNRSFGEFLENKTQPIVREFAFIVDENIDTESVLFAYKDNMIKSVELVDIYRNEKIGIGKKSIAFRMVLKPKNQLTSDEIDKISDQIIWSITKKTNGVLRDGA